MLDLVSVAGKSYAELAEGVGGQGLGGCSFSRRLVGQSLHRCILYCLARWSVCIEQGFKGLCIIAGRIQPAANCGNIGRSASNNLHDCCQTPVAELNRK